jgi:hypothetical protein
MAPNKRKRKRLDGSAKNTPNPWSFDRDKLVRWVINAVNFQWTGMTSTAGLELTGPIACNYSAARAAANRLWRWCNSGYRDVARLFGDYGTGKYVDPARYIANADRYWNEVAVVEARRRATSPQRIATRAADPTATAF